MVMSSVQESMDLPRNGVYSPLYKENRILSPRNLKSLFDGLSPVRDESLKVSMQQKYTTMVKDAQNAPVLSGNVFTGRSREGGSPTASAAAKAKATGISDAANILASTCTAIATPFKESHVPVVSGDDCNDAEGGGSSPGLLSSVLSAVTPTTKGGKSAWDLLAPTPTTTSHNPGAKLAVITPGDMAILGCSGVEEDSGDTVAAYSCSPALPSKSLPLFVPPKSALRVALPLPQPAGALKADVTTPPSKEEFTRRVLFDVDTPPTPPMPERASFGSMPSTHYRLSLEQPSAPMPVAASLCSSPRAEMLKSASKQLSSVMDMLSTVCVGLESSPLNAIATDATTPEASAEHPPLYVKPASWTPLHSSRTSTATAKSTGKKRSPPVATKTGYGTMGPPQRTPGKGMTPSKGFRNMMMSGEVVGQVEEVPSPFKAKTPLKRSPMRVCTETSPPQQMHVPEQSTISPEVRSDAPTQLQEVSLVQLHVSTLETDMCQSLLMEQPLQQVAVPYTANRVMNANKLNHTSDNSRNQVKDIKMAGHIFETFGESPIAAIAPRARAATSQHLSRSTGKGACIAPSSDFCDGDGYSDEEENATPTNKGVNCTTDSARKYKVLMHDCSDLLSEIDNMLV